MNNDHNLGLIKTPDLEKLDVFLCLTKTTIRYKDILSDLIDAGYDIQQSQKFPDKYLLLFERAVKEPYLVVFCHYSGKFLCKLSHTYPSAEELFIKLSSDKSSAVRLNNVTNLLHRPSKKVLDSVIAKGLKDSSSKVRAKTADVISRLDLKEYAEILPEYIDKEEKINVKEEMQLCLFWLIHDYKIKEKDEYGYHIQVKTDTGYYGATLKEEEYRQLDKTIEQIKNGTFRWE